MFLLEPSPSFVGRMEGPSAMAKFIESPFLGRKIEVVSSLLIIFEMTLLRFDCFDSGRCGLYF
jgi:hypothetical protein